MLPPKAALRSPEGAGPLLPPAPGARSGVPTVPAPARAPRLPPPPLPVAAVSATPAQAPRASASIPPLRIRIPAPGEAARAMTVGDIEPALTSAEDLAGDEPSFPDHFSDPPPATEERDTDQGAGLMPPPALVMSGSSLRSMLVTPVEVVDDDTEEAAFPLASGSPLLARAAGAAPAGHGALGAVGLRPANPYAPAPLLQGPASLRAPRPERPPSLSSASSLPRPALPTVADLQARAQRQQAQRRAALLFLLFAISLLLLINVHPGVLEGDLPFMGDDAAPTHATRSGADGEALPTTPPDLAPEGQPTEGQPTEGQPTEGQTPETPAAAPVVAPAPTPPVQVRPTPPKVDPAPARSPSPKDEARIHEEQNSKGVLVIKSQPAAVIYLDGRRIGMTPIDRYEVAPGGHVIKAVISGRPTQERAVRISATEAREVNFQF